jgi:hypothetical protein
VGKESINRGARSNFKTVDAEIAIDAVQRLLLAGNTAVTLMYFLR